MPDDVTQVHKLAGQTPSETLRAAAARLLAMAAKATPGPWFTPPREDIAEWSIYGDDWMIASTHHYPRSDMVNDASKLRKPASVVEHANQNAEWIATMSPVVAEPLARELERHAIEIDMWRAGTVGYLAAVRIAEHALAFAHSILDQQ